MTASEELKASVNQALKAAGVADDVDNAGNDKSIAVLPFSDLNENSDLEYFAVGMSRDLISRLALIPDLKVAGRESSFYYKGRDAEAATIGDGLQVENILLGSVQKSGDNLRVTVQLVSAGDGTSIWSGTYNRQLIDVFAIQAEIVAEVATVLDVTLIDDDFSNMGLTGNVEAYDKVLQALSLSNQFIPADISRAIKLLEEAVQLDPEYGRGWLILADLYEQGQFLMPQDQTGDFPAQTARAFEHAAKIAPDMPALMWVEANGLRNQGRFLEAENLYRQYLASFGDSAVRVVEEYGHMLARTGQFNEAIAMFNRARKIDPLAPRTTYQVALHQLVRGLDNEALALMAHGQKLEDGDYLFSALEWEMAMREGRFEEAAFLIRSDINALNDNVDLPDGTSVSRRFLEKFATILTQNDFDTSRQAINALINDPAITPLELGYVAQLVALMGQPELALDYWFGVDASPVIWDKVYDDMRRLPDFNRLLQEKGMVDYWRATGNWGDFCVAAGGRDFVCQ